MPIDYTPAPSAYHVAYENNNQGGISPSNAQDETTQQNNTNEIVSLNGNANFDFESIFNPKTLWGPVGARLIPNTKHTLAKVFSRNISDLSEGEYNQLRYLIEYIATNPASKARVFELTGFNDKDLAFAQKYFQKYESRFMFSKLVKFALDVSSDGRVSKQIGGILQFIFETDAINGQQVADEYKYKLLRGIPNLVEPIWEQASNDCNSQVGLCSDQYKDFLDLNADNKIDKSDIELAKSSLQWIKDKSYKTSNN